MNQLSHRILTIAALVALTAGVTGCGSSNPARPRPASTATTAARTSSTPVSSATIRIQNYAYHPADIALLPGARVTFSNLDATAHTATAKAGPAKFDTGTVGPRRSVTVILRRPGTYSYYCQFHAFMVARLTVVGK